MKSKAKELRSQEGRGRAVLLGATPRLGLAPPFLNLEQPRGGGVTINLAVVWLYSWVGSAIQRLSGDRSKPRLKVASLLGLLTPKITSEKSQNTFLMIMQS